MAHEAKIHDHHAARQDFQKYSHAGATTVERMLRGSLKPFKHEVEKVIHLDLGIATKTLVWCAIGVEFDQVKMK